MKYQEYNFDTTGYPKEMLVGSTKGKRMVLGVTTNLATTYYLTIDKTGATRYFTEVEDLPNTKPRTIKDGLQYGDIIENDTHTRKVLGICGDVYLMSYDNDNDLYNTGYTLIELINKGYILKQPEETKEIVELTIEDIAKLKGVDPSTIRVKD